MDLPIIDILTRVKLICGPFDGSGEVYSPHGGETEVTVSALPLEDRSIGAIVTRLSRDFEGVVPGREQHKEIFSGFEQKFRAKLSDQEGTVEFGDGSYVAQWSTRSGTDTVNTPNVVTLHVSIYTIHPHLENLTPDQFYAFFDSQEGCKFSPFD